MIRILVVDDQALVRGALAALLDLEDDLTVVGQVADGPAAVGFAAEHPVDVVLLDIEMPRGGGIEALPGLVACPGRPRVLVVTTFGRPGYLRRALDAGASGFVVKDCPPAELVEAVRRTHAGLRTVDTELATASALAGPNPLTARETDVLRLAADGRSSSEIAAALFLSPGTVRNHLSSAIGKTGARTSAGAATTARDNGWL
ncbi:response regulator [Kytococcus sp. Marseille-QA3725]